MKIYDLIIVGAGPAGLTAALYAARYKLDTLVIGRLPGGMISEAHKVCNFPTYEEINGFELSQKMVNQVKSLGVEIKMHEVVNIEGSDGDFVVKTSSGEERAKKIIFAILVVVF